MQTVKTTHRFNVRDRSSARGSSLVEVMIALAIFGVFIASSCKVLLAARTTLDLARDHYTASNIAKGRIELVHTLDFNQIPELEEDMLVIDGSGTPSEYGHFRRSTTVSMVSSNLFEVAVTVGIQNRKTLEFSPSEQTVNTYISKHL
ncbi:MAG: prepilin-type N-terminal cleavage/methylation domain-containing protein [Pontiellaceae bacterium]|nr:prepilin-type N-terminal cleavage/methylation domain-containing protein [Pontiellaceae bacterium]